METDLHMCRKIRQAISLDHFKSSLDQLFYMHRYLRYTGRKKSWWHRSLVRQVIFCHLPSPWSACFLQLLSEVMPQSHWLHFYFHWEVKPKLLKLPAVVEGYWSLFWTHFAAVFRLSLTAAPEPQMLEVQEKDPCYFILSVLWIDPFPTRNRWFILHTLRIWKYSHLSNCSTSVCLHVCMGNCLGFKLGQFLRPSSSEEMSRWAKVQHLGLPRAKGTPVKNLCFVLENVNSHSSIETKYPG